MQESKHYSNTRHLTITMLSALLGLVLLESRGLVVWADRLETGTLQHIAQPVTQWMDQRLRPLRIGEMRPAVLHQLEVIGWSESSTQLPPLAPTERTDLPTPATLSSIATPITPAAPVIAALMPVADTLAAVPTQTPLHANLSELNARPTLRIGLVGDSMMAVGLSAVLQQHWTIKGRVQFTRAYKSGTGLARPDTYNWQQQYPILIGSPPPDLVIVSIGANDAQNFVQADQVIKFGSTEWRKQYGQRVIDFMGELTQHGTQVIWVGLPPMKKAGFDQKIDQINRLTYAIVQQYPNSSWWNPAPYLVNAQGEFIEFGETQTGKTVRLRALDGIHLSNEGADRLATPLMQWLSPSAAAPASPANSTAATPLPLNR